jgi:hypothetical protein
MSWMDVKGYGCGLRSNLKLEYDVIDVNGFICGEVFGKTFRFFFVSKNINSMNLVKAQN